jgi:hypothetical protein
LSCYAIGLGTLFGGWRIVKTMGQKITKLKPVGGFAETGGAITLFIATALGIPVSTTHTITGAIVGVGSSENVGSPWGVAGNIVWAWVSDHSGVRICGCDCMVDRHEDSVIFKMKSGNRISAAKNARWLPGVCFCVFVF